jgi:hypothetical protein
MTQTSGRRPGGGTAQAAVPFPFPGPKQHCDSHET